MLDRKKQTDIVSYFGIIVSILVGLIGLYSQSKDPQTSLILFLALIVFIFLFFLLSWPIDYLKKNFQNINRNSEDIELIKKDLNIIKDKLNFRKDVENLNIKIAMIENLLKIRGKKGQIDPRWILIIIIIILFYLYLKSKGYNWFW